mmetsp:Transcript_18453/g.46412  ORF Transcript_18453/g.46412 Transcript_18453/m.46412 type:complete len:215 (-) Transcript_18453:29-673(-)
MLSSCSNPSLMTVSCCAKYMAVTRVNMPSTTNSQMMWRTENMHEHALLFFDIPTMPGMRRRRRKPPIEGMGASMMRESKLDASFITCTKFSALHSNLSKPSVQLAQSVTGLHSALPKNCWSGKEKAVMMNAPTPIRPTAITILKVISKMEKKRAARTPHISGTLVAVRLCPSSSLPLLLQPLAAPCYPLPATRCLLWYNRGRGEGEGEKKGKER